MLSQTGHRARRQFVVLHMKTRPDRERNRGRAAGSVESVRLDPELRQALTERAHRDHETTSSVIRKALRRYLDAA